jgi:hypothetical protein
VGKVRVTRAFPGSIHEAELCWYDTKRWPDWVDGLRRVIDVDTQWPRTGSTVVWESGPAGRGRVRERVVAYEARRGQTVEVEDGSITGTQALAFAPTNDGVEVTLTLQYAIKQRSPLTPLVDLLFVRRAMGASLAKTLAAFGAALEESRRRGVG